MASVNGFRLIIDALEKGEWYTTDQFVAVAGLALQEAGIKWTTGEELGKCVFLMLELGFIEDDRKGNIRVAEHFF